MTLPRRSWEVPAWLGVLVVALIARLWDLGARVMSHDESLHAYYSLQLFNEGVYRHDPVYHGPWLYHVNAAMYYLFGASDFTARLAPAVVGALLVASMWLFRGNLGRLGSLSAAALAALGPTILFYSRHIREDIYVAFFTVVWVYSAFRYVNDRRRAWLYLVVVSMAGSFISKETSFIFGTIVGLFFLVIALGLTRADQPLRQAAGDLAALMLTIALPFVSGLAFFLLGWPPNLQETPSGSFTPRAAVMATFFASSAALAGAWFRPRFSGVPFVVWGKLMLTFWAIAVTFFTGFFTNVPAGIVSGVVGSLGYWLTQQEVARAGQPWFYYGVIALLYEFVPVMLACVGSVALLRDGLRRSPAPVFLAFALWWAASSWVLYAWAGEKMPWLLMHQIIPVYLLAGWTIAALARHLARSADRRRVLAVSAAAAAVLVLAVGVAERTPFAGRGIAEASASAAWYLRVVLLLAVAVAVRRHLRIIGARGASIAAAAGILAVLALVNVRTSLQLNFVNYDRATELMSYAQASPDVKRVLGELRAIDDRTGGDRQLEIAYDDDSSWPWVWYLREFPNSRTWAADATLARSAPVILVGPKNRAALERYVASGYAGQRHFLYWWPLQDYQHITIPRLASSLLRPDFRAYLWNVFFHREFGIPLNDWPIRREFDVYVRDGLSEPAAASVVTDVAVQGTQRVAGPIAGVTLRAPTSITVARDGALLVADTGNHRVVVLNADGSMRQVIGAGRCALTDAQKPGCADPDGSGPLAVGDGQLNEPWGVAEGPDGYYVSDTWNGRVQVFDERGAFLRKWGTFGQPSGDETRLYGPRGLAFDDELGLLVADTGNKRVLVFDRAGRVRTEIGASATLPEFFNEPTSVAVDPNGTLLVADAWNQRIVRVDRRGHTLAAWRVPAWQARAPDDKPFLAVDASGFIYATDVEHGSILMFTPAGKSLRRIRVVGPGGDATRPAGIAVGADGRTLLLTDRAGDRVLSIALTW